MLNRVATSIAPPSSHAFSTVPVRSSCLSRPLRTLRTPALRYYSSSFKYSSRPALVSSISPRASASTYKAFSTTTIMAKSTRTETDAFGPIEVESDKYWGAQTQRSLGNFNINQPQDRMPEGVVRAFGILKGAAATVNMKYGLGML